MRKELVEKDTASGVQHTTAKGVPYRAMGISEDVYIHPSSVLATTSPPDYVVYHEVVRTSQVWLKGRVIFPLISTGGMQTSLTLVNRFDPHQPCLAALSWELFVYIFKAF